MDSTGSVYVADQYNHVVRKITSGGVVATLAGMAGSPGATDGIGSAAQFNYPTGVAVDSAGNVYVTDRANHTVRKITSGGVVTTLAGTAGSPGATDGTGSAAQFNYPIGVAVDGAGNVYVADRANHTIRKITSGGVVTTLAGTVGSFGATDGTGSVAQFHFPTGVAVDSSGTVYVADQNNATIRKVTSGGVVTTLAGMAGSPGATDGTGSAARFQYPTGVAVDSAGNVFVADRENHTIRMITSSGVVTTLAGTAGSPGATDGTGSAAGFFYPFDIAVDSAGNLYVADTLSNTIRLGTPPPEDFNGLRSIWLMNGTAFSSEVNLMGTGDTSWRLAVAADFNGDGKADILWRNTITGQCYLWLMNGSVQVGGFDLGVVANSQAIAAAADFNEDGKADILWRDLGTGRCYLWLMNGTTHVSDVDLEIVDKAWTMVAAADFTGDGKTDILWQNLVSGQRYVWVMNGTVHVGAVDMGITDRAWSIAVAADFNGDGKPDILWQNVVTGQRYLWLMNGTTQIGAADLGVVDTARTIVAAADFNGDGKPDLLWQAAVARAYDFNRDSQADILWQNVVTGQRYLWLMNGTVHAAAADLGVVDPVWSITAVADFTGDGQPDLLWQNTLTGQCKFWLMNGTTHAGSVDLGVVDPVWSIVAAADFTGDGQPDILWRDMVSGQCYLWLMNGTTQVNGADFGLVDPAWSIAAVADFNGDSQPDILWQNTATGQCKFWLMNGTTHASDVDLGVFDQAWSIAVAADFNGDGQPDILWQNTVSGQRYIWLMNGTNQVGAVDLGLVDIDWRLVR